LFGCPAPPGYVGLFELARRIWPFSSPQTSPLPPKTLCGAAPFSVFAIPLRGKIHRQQNCWVPPELTFLCSLRTPHSVECFVVCPFALSPPTFAHPLHFPVNQIASAGGPGGDRYSASFPPLPLLFPPPFFFCSPSSFGPGSETKSFFFLPVSVFLRGPLLPPFKTLCPPAVLLGSKGLIKKMVVSGSPLLPFRLSPLFFFPDSRADSRRPCTCFVVKKKNWLFFFGWPFWFTLPCF